MALKAKKIPYYLIVFLLTLGAGLIVGLLSFGGMWAFMLDWSIGWTVTALVGGSLTAAVFSFVFEIEVFFQNTKKGIGKLINADYLKQFFGEKFFNKFYRDDKPNKTNEAEKPQLLKDYDLCEKQLTELKKQMSAAKEQIEKAQKIKDRTKRKAEIAKYTTQLAEYKVTEKKILKNQRTLKKIFTEVLFSKSIDKSDTANAYQVALKNWLDKGNRAVKHANIHNKLHKYERRYFWAKVFSIVSLPAYGIGTLFLLSNLFETVSVIALFAGPIIASPMGIVVMSLIAGAAYGMLTFNAITDMMNNKTLQKWRKNFFHNGLKYDAPWKKITMWIIGAALVVLALFITVCTAGTWWTATTNLPTFLGWLTNIPMRVIDAFRLTISITIGIATLIFDLQNTSESLEILDKGLKGSFDKEFQKIKKGFRDLWESEWTIEKLNPFRALLIITVVVVQVVLFLGHLLCMGVDSDQTPWDISERFLTLASGILEFAVDFHYVGEIFGGGHKHDSKEPCEAHGSHEAHDHDHESHESHGHEHHIDIPKIVAITVAYALFWLPAKIWSEVFGRIRCYCLKPKSDSQSELKAGIASEVEPEIKEGTPRVVQEAAPAPEAIPAPIVVVAAPKQTLELSQEGQAELACYKMQKKAQHHLNSWFGSVGKSLAVEKHQGVIRKEIKLQKELRTKTVDAMLEETCQDKAITKHRGFGFFGIKNADTRDCMKDLQEQVSVTITASAAAA